MSDAGAGNVEVRVEWGVRWGSLPPSAMVPCNDEEYARKWVAGLTQDPDSSDAAAYTRTVTTTPWTTARPTEDPA